MSITPITYYYWILATGTFLPGPFGYAVNMSESRGLIVLPLSFLIPSYFHVSKGDYRTNVVCAVFEALAMPSTAINK